MSRRRLRALFLPLVLAGCAADAVEAEDVDPGDPASEGALSGASCDARSSALFFHGMHGYGRGLGGEGVCAPKMADDGATSFWSDVAFVGAPAADVVAGYSAGRVPLLRRLARGESHETTAILLDGSWADGPRFDGVTGPAIVDAWLDEDPARRFVLVYLRSSAGWKEYAALATGAHADRVRLCEAHGSHLELPGIVGRDLVLAPERFLDERCASGRLR